MKSRLTERLQVRSLSICGLLVLLVASPLYGDLIVSDLTSTPSGTGISVADLMWVAAEFTTDSQAYTLDSITASVAEDTPGALVVELFSDTSGEPGSPIGSFTVPSVGPTFSLITFSSVGVVTLAPNTSYYVLMRAPTGDPGDYTWGFTSDDPPVVTGPGTVSSGLQFSLNHGSSWNVGVGATPLFAVEGTVIPEPTTCLLFALGGLGLVLQRRSRKRSLYGWG